MGGRGQGHAGTLQLAQLGKAQKTQTLSEGRATLKREQQTHAERIPAT